MKVISMFRKEGIIPVTVATVVSLFLIVSAVQATTTISTDITTGGAISASTTLQVTGAQTNYGAFTVSGTGATTLGGALSVTGASTYTGLASFGQASTTRLSVFNTAYFGGTATSSFTSAGVLTLQNGETISNATDGTITLTAATTTVTGDLRINPNGRIYVHPTLADRETGEYINQAIKADVTLGSTFGASDSSDEWFGSAIRSRLMGSNLTGANNTVGALEGSYQITGTNASTYPKGAVLGEIGGNSTTADGAFVAYTDGDVGTLNSAGAAFKVMNNNNAASGSKFNYGLDIFDAGHAGLAAVTLAKADIRMVNGDTISNTAASSTSITGTLTANNLTAATTTATTALVIPSGTTPTAGDSCANTANGAIRIDTDGAVGGKIIACIAGTWTAN